MRHPQISRKQRLGFTLIELMIAMLAGSITLAGGYYLSTMSVRSLGDQMRASDAQMSLRMAMDQVRRDFSRAAYFGSRNSTTLPALACAVTTNSLGQPITTANVTINGSAAALAANILNPGNGAAANLTRADLVTLDGGFAIGTMFLVDNTVVQAPNVVGIDPNTATFQMAFSPPTACCGAPVYNAARFNQVFQAGRVLRFENDGNYYFRRITGSNGALAIPTITLDQALPDVGCAPRGSSYAAVVSRIEYRVEPIVLTPAPAAAADILSLVTPLPGGVLPVLGSRRRAALVRRELDILNGAVFAGSASIVLDNVVEFQVNGIRNSAAPGVAPVFAVADSFTAPTIQQVSQVNPEQLRSMVVTLSVRAMEGDRVRAHLPRQPFPGADNVRLTRPMLSFQMGAGPADPEFFVSRVKTMRSEIFLPNTIN